MLQHLRDIFQEVPCSNRVNYFPFITSANPFFLFHHYIQILDFVAQISICLSLLYAVFSVLPRFMRVDTLSLMLSMANVSAYSDALVVDMVAGLVVGAVAERLGGKLCFFFCVTGKYFVLNQAIQLNGIYLYADCASFSFKKRLFQPNYLLTTYADFIGKLLFISFLLGMCNKMLWHVNTNSRELCCLF